MKIITWNCNMAYRTKARAILKHKPDILIVQECECPDKLLFGKGVPLPRQVLWYGSNKNKGIGIFSYSDFRFKELPCHNKTLKMVIPIEVTNGVIQFNLYAVWANNPLDKGNQYVGQIWKALTQYDELLSSHNSILIGDFNSNSIWDKPRRSGNHTHVVEKLLEKNISSCYHTYHQCEQGKEKHNTLFLYRHRDKGYHIDYCFASGHFINRLQSVKVGMHRYWSGLSDHVPLFFSFD